MRVAPLTVEEEAKLRNDHAGDHQHDTWFVDEGNCDESRLLATIDSLAYNVRALTLIIDKLLTRSPIDTRGACAYCNVYAGQLEIAGKMQWVQRHSEQCPYKIGLALFGEG